MSEGEAALPAHAVRVRRHLRITGVVQGVGFRPFVHRLALELGLGGFVGNDAGGVFVEVEGDEAAVLGLAERIEADAPPAARIAAIAVQPREPTGERDFRIVESRDFAGARTLVSPDLATCDECSAEIRDPDDVRYGHAFANCTSCGPRYTIIRGVPYDRPLTTMAGFAMCDRCRAEYEDPGDRRYHAQPNACPTCGPRLGVLGAPTAASDRDVIGQVVRRLGQGEIVALKGLGGFHLACDATDPAVVARLRERKGRPAKPLALMVATLDDAERLCVLDDVSREILTGPEAPIVLAPWRRSARLEGIAPGNAEVGIMLPYTPLHLLLFDRWAEAHAARGGAKGVEWEAIGIATPVPALVMTSANPSGLPILVRDDEARAGLAGIADAIVSHDRPIHARADDSVVRTVNGAPQPLRRSRGYAPFPIPLPREVPPTLAVGGELKSTFCFAAGSLGFLSPHIGDMQNLETLEAFAEAVAHFESLFGVEPERVVCDLHPGYLSSSWARRRWPDRIVEVQHHHAHVAALRAELRAERRAENGSDDAALLGLAFDGTGYGTDGAVWGGEVLRVDDGGAERVAHLAYTRLPGGDAAVRRPYRHALSLLRAAAVAWDDDLPPVLMCRAGEREVVAHQVGSGLGSPLTSSVGRLFDGVSALLGVCDEATYEGEAAIRLEALAREAEPEPRYAFALRPNASGPVEFDPSPVIRGIVADLRGGVPTDRIAAAFHRGLADLAATLCVPELEARPGDPRRVGLTGGVFQNRLLTSLTIDALTRAGVEVGVHRLVPPNDGGLAFGQVVVGGCPQTL